MAYQNVGTPRFYIDTPSYLNSMGVEYGEGLNKDLFGLNINKQTLIENLTHNFTLRINTPMPLSKLFNTNKGYVGFLNHTISSDNYFQMNLGEQSLNSSNVININTSSSPQIENKGFSMWSFQESEIELSEIKISDIYYANPTAGEFLPLYMGGITFGSYYDMPHSSELNISMEITNDGVKSIQTNGGSYLKDVVYNGAPMWKRNDGSEVPPWTIGQPIAVGRRMGRRSWSLNFNYLDEKDLLSSNYMSNQYIENNSGYNSADLGTNLDNLEEQFYFNINNDDSFVAQVLNKVGNGQRFIFQPDNTNNNPDQFAICQLDANKLVVNQVSNGLYNISLNIVEIW